MITVLLIAFTSTVCLADKPVPPECKDKYQCFVPGDCVWWASNESIGQVNFGLNQIDDQCGAMLKIHKFNDHWILIEMESLDKSVSAINLEYDNEEILSCTKSNGIVTVTTPHRKDEGLTRISDKGGILKCTVGLKNRLKIIQLIGKIMKLTISKNGIKSEYNDMQHTFKNRCDPSRLRFAMDENEEEREYLYSPVKYSPMSAYCERNGFFRTMEYRQEGNDEYTEISSLRCARNKSSGFKFTIDEVAVEDGKNLVVRCVADASFFCDYDPKSRHGETALIRTNAVESTSSPSKLECPPGYQYLIVNNKSPKKGITMSCQIYGGRMAYWTTSEGQILARTGPEVYCANKLPCKRIPSKNVKSGMLVDSGMSPKCFENGNMTISDEYGLYQFDEENGLKCDEAIGKLKFNGNGASIIVTEKTIFTCTYPQTEASISEEAVNIALYVTTGTCAVIVIIFILVAPKIAKCMFSSAKKRQNEHALNKDETEWQQFVKVPSDAAAAAAANDDDGIPQKERRCDSSVREGSGDSKKDDSSTKGISGKMDSDKSSSGKNMATTKKEGKMRELQPKGEHVTRVNQAARKLVNFEKVLELPWSAEELEWEFAPEDYENEPNALEKFAERPFATMADEELADHMGEHADYLPCLSEAKIAKAIKKALEK